MTYEEMATELENDIKHDINHSNTISLESVEKWNRIITAVMYGSTNWRDEYVSDEKG